jgi:PKD repeat protein
MDVTKRLFLVAALAAMAGCALDKQNAPGLSGPSEFGLSIEITATPDILSGDGVSQAVVPVFARDPQAQPVRGLTLRAEIINGDGVPVDIGALSSRTISTGTDGRASITYLVPAAPSALAGDDIVVGVRVSAVGTNFANMTPRFVLMQLRRPGVILPPNGAPTADFFFSPTSPRESESILFDGSPSTDPDGSIVSYQWNFGDGAASSGIRTTHAYSVEGTYNVVLTVTDDRGVTATSVPKTVSVSRLQFTAAFTVSPTDPIVGAAVHFNGRSSVPASGRSIASYDWDFGDSSPHGGGAEVDHVYGKVGTFTVVLVVTDSTGQQAVTSRTVTVK